MIELNRNRIENAKLTASQKVARNLERDAEFRREKEQRDQAIVAKMTRLRALRFAKEAEGREARAAEDAARRTAAAMRTPTRKKSRRGGASNA